MTDKLKLLVETIDDSFATELVEGTVGKKDLHLKGIFLQTDVVNRNGRLYESRWFDKHIEQYIKEQVEPCIALGEYNHPPRPKVDSTLASHRIVSLIKEGSNWKGDLIINEEGTGKIVRGLVGMGTRLGVSSRAVGTVKPKNGIKYVNESTFKLMTAADIVLDPSAPDAFVTAIMEQKEFIWDGNELVECYLDEQTDIINNLARSNKLKQNLKFLFETIFEEIKARGKQ